MSAAQPMNNAPIDANLEGSNPKLQTVKYINILPEGKVADYKQNNRVDFMPDPSTAAYFDGKQSYINIEVTNDSTFVQGNSPVAPTAAPPVCFPAHIGANAMINRCLIRSKENGQVIEDLEGYNQLHGIKNAYSHDSDVFKSLGRISGVAGRSCRNMNQTVDNLAVNYFLPNCETQTAGQETEAVGGNVGVSAQFCVPIESGLFSAFAGEHHCVPNLDVPLHLQFFLEKNNVALQTMNHKFYRTVIVNGTSVVDQHALNPFSDELTFTKAGTSMLLSANTCDTTLSYDGLPYSQEMCAFRIGQIFTDGTDQRAITKVEINQGAGNQIELTLDSALSAGDGDIATCKLNTITRSYTINKIELKLLVTIPDEPTMRMIRAQMARGISFTSQQLYKVSTASALLNSVIDIPEALTRCKSIIALPCRQSNLEALDLSNSYIMPQPVATVNATYQWQIQNTLIPNLSVETADATNNKNDNVIYFNQSSMALRHWLDVKALGDHPKVEKTSDKDLLLPYFFPVSLSPKGQSFNLIDAAPQLRVNNDAPAAADVPAYLFHIYICHIRVLKAGEMGAEINF